MVDFERTEKEKTAIEHRDAISSTKGTATYLLNMSRKHWGIETSLHWSLDIA